MMKKVLLGIAAVLGLALLGAVHGGFGSVTGAFIGGSDPRKGGCALGF